MVQVTRLSPIKEHIWNINDDYRIKRVFSDRYTGCKSNYEWLILRFFDMDCRPSSNTKMTVLDWLLK
jgi:hypothetical protein